MEQRPLLGICKGLCYILSPTLLVGSGGSWVPQKWVSRPQGAANPCLPLPGAD